ncbi:MAG: hypothetical protein ACJAU7_001312 [Parvibaculaceae bacterium]|jgi:hypothetical protein
MYDKLNLKRNIWTAICKLEQVPHASAKDASEVVKSLRALPSSDPTGGARLADRLWVETLVRLRAALNLPEKDQ